MIISVFVTLCLPISSTSHFPSQNATGTELYFLYLVFFWVKFVASRPTSTNTAHNQTFYFHFCIFLSKLIGRFCSDMFCAVFPAYLGSSFIQEALHRARELTDAAYAHTSERWDVKNTPERKHYRSVSTKRKHKTGRKWFNLIKYVYFPSLSERKRLYQTVLSDPMTCWLCSNKLARKPDPTSDPPSSSTTR